MRRSERSQIIQTFRQWQLGYPVHIGKIEKGQYAVQTDCNPQTIFLYNVKGGAIKVVKQDVVQLGKSKAIKMQKLRLFD